MLRNGFVIIVGTLLIISLVAPASVLADGSGTFKVSRTMTVGGTEIESGQYRVKYEANGQEADVTFRVNGKVAAKVPGRIVERDDKSNYDALEVENDSSGNDVIKSIRFRGEKTAIVFE